MKNTELREKDRTVLSAVVEAYLKAGRPVSSGFLSQKRAVPDSPATIRNIMVKLSELGFLSQPHASAGRIPTDKGLRFYVNRLLEAEPFTFDRIGALPADGAGFPDLPEDRKHWMRQEIYWSEQVRLFNVLTREKGKDFAYRWVGDGIGNGVGYQLGAAAWIPFVPPHRAFILYLCWEYAKLLGDKVTLEKLDDKEAVVRLEDLTYFALYMRATHLKQQISLEDYIKIFETIWQERARAAGWTLVIDGRGRQIYLRFSR